MKPPNCCICDEKPAPYPHPLHAEKRLCRECRELMQMAEDQSARNRRGDDRLGDAGERRAMREGRQVKGGRG